MLAMHRARHGGHRILLLAAVGVVVIALAVGIVTILFPPIEEMPTPRQQPKPQPVVPVSISSRMLFMGDVYWGRYINDWSQASPLKYAYPFSGLKGFDRESYDAWIADMECPITNNPKVSSAVEDDTLQFDCSPKYLPEAAKWFTAFTLANNHTDNQGAQTGLDETMKHLDAHGIQHFGTFDPEDHDNVCEVLGVPVTITLSDETQKKGHVPMAMCGYHGVFKTPTPASVALLTRYSKVMPTLAWPHSGAEYKAEPDSIKTTLFRSMIDAGADAVIGDHPHWIQSTEAYKGHLIAYSMGNFIFDQQYNREVTRSAPIQLTVKTDTVPTEQLEAWLKLGEQCVKHKDDCLEQAETQQLEELPLSYRFGAIGSDNLGRLVKPASSELLRDIKKRLRWEQTAAGLSAPYSAAP